MWVPRAARPEHWESWRKALTDDSCNCKDHKVSAGFLVITCVPKIEVSDTEYELNHVLKRNICCLQKTSAFWAVSLSFPVLQSEDRWHEWIGMVGSSCVQVLRDTGLGLRSSWSGRTSTLGSSVTCCSLATQNRRCQWTKLMQILLTWWVWFKPNTGRMQTMTWSLVMYKELGHQTIPTQRVKRIVQWLHRPCHKMVIG